MAAAAGERITAATAAGERITAATAIALMAASCGHHACSLDLVGDSQNEACHFAVADHHHLAQHLNPMHKGLLIAAKREMGYPLFMQCLAINTSSMGSSYTSFTHTCQHCRTC